MMRLIPLLFFLAAAYTAFKPQIHDYLNRRAAENRRRRRARDSDRDSAR